MIGGDGLSPELRGKARPGIAFGAATWPHQMVRVMLLEQIYRAATILAGHLITVREKRARRKRCTKRGTQTIANAAESGQRSSVAVTLSLALLSAGFALPAAAQIAPLPPVSADAIKQREQELEAARVEQRNAAELRQKLQAAIAAIGQDRSKLNQQLIDTAGQVRTIETRIIDAESRLRPLDSREAQIRGSLDSRRSEIVEVLAALQRAGRRTPPALLVRPEDALQSLRTAMLLGAVVPELRGRAGLLPIWRAGRLAQADRQRTRQARARPRPAEGRPDSIGALVDERQRKQAAVERTWKPKAPAP